MTWAEFCEAMRAERQRQDLTTRELALKMGVSQSGVCDRESARHGPSLPGLALWGDALGVLIHISVKFGGAVFWIARRGDHASDRDGES